MVFILASRSPQRREILANLGVAFEVIPSSYDESLCPERNPAKRAVILAQEKAKSVAADHPGRWVIGVDTLVVSESGEILEKPVDAEDARRMLWLQSGRQSAVHSGLCVVRREERETREARELREKKETDECFTALSTAYVTFRELSGSVIEAWITSGMWQERSGSFQIDMPGKDSKKPISKTPIKNSKIQRYKEIKTPIISFAHHPLIASLEGEYETVVGFPVAAFQSIQKTILMQQDCRDCGQEPRVPDKAPSSFLSNS